MTTGVAERLAEAPCAGPDTNATPVALPTGTSGTVTCGDGQPKDGITVFALQENRWMLLDLVPGDNLGPERTAETQSREIDFPGQDPMAS